VNAAAQWTVLVTDRVLESGLAPLRDDGRFQVVKIDDSSTDEFREALKTAHGLVVRSATKVRKELLDQAPELRVVGRAGVGVDNIDLEAATAKGIVVMNSAEASTISTAEHAFALMMALARNIGPAYATMREGGWDRSKYTGRQLAGKTLGVVGFGRIGQTVAARALAFDMNVVAFDPLISAPTMMEGRVRMFQDFEEMLPLADILTFHVPLTDRTRGMLGAEQFRERCKPGVLVVNAARGGVIDEPALLEALDAGQCGGAAVDVYPTEPPPSDDPLRAHPKVLTTPHLGASTKEAQQAVSVAAAEQLLAFLRGEGVRGAVNAGDLRVDLDPVQAAFVDLAARMAKLISPMVTRGFSEIRLTVEGRQIACAAGTIERTALMHLLQPHFENQLNIINVASMAEERGIAVKVQTSDEPSDRGSQVTLEIVGPRGAVDRETHPADQTRRIVGRVYDDLRPRVVEINGYHMDMIPAGSMVLIQNEDRPGMVARVGAELGQAEINIADMHISRRDRTALMLLHVDNPPSADLPSRLTSNPGILKCALVELPPEPGSRGG